jgi:mannose-6-phosphate isomerase-like protein (cupin superfamily)
VKVHVRDEPDPGVELVASGAQSALAAFMRKLAMGLITMAALSGVAVLNAAEQQAPFTGNVGSLAEQSSDFRRVLFTGPHMQLVTMSLQPAENIGEEVHRAVDQCFFLVDGKGESVIAGKATPFNKDDAVCVPAGTRHDIRNTGDKPLKLYTLYAPPQHPAGTVHHTKADAERAEKKY